MLEVNKQYCMDNRDGLAQLDDDSVDLILTDPQYGWSFMGKDWDKALPPQTAYDECFRVLKPGAFMFWMSGARFDNLIENGIRIRNSGFNTNFTPLFWAFATGFPKAQNISKEVDKRFGAEREIIGNDPEAKRRNKTTSKFSNLYGSIEDIPAIPLTLPSSPEAKDLDGSYAGFQPKQAVEVIIVAMKPLTEKTYIDQALVNKNGVTWLDACRIPTDAILQGGSRLLGDGIKYGKINALNLGDGGFVQSPSGRFPANLLVSDDVLNDGTNHKSGNHNEIRKEVSHTCFGGLKDYYVKSDGDEGSFSRYFSLDAWWSNQIESLPESIKKTFPFLIVPKASESEKNDGCELLFWERDESDYGFHQIDKAYWTFLIAEEKRIYKETGKRVSLQARGNIHPTVKPIALGSYLVTLGSREGDLIVDPYAGVGSFPIAAKMLNRPFVAFDIYEENCIIAKKRLAQETFTTFFKQKGVGT